MTRKKVIWGSGFLGAIVFIAMGAYWVLYLQVAHSSFENYYKFRGCAQLVEKTDTYAFCKIKSGQTIKLIQVKEKWFLDGDLGF